LQLTTQGHYDISSGTVSCDSATMASTVVSLRASHLRWPPPARLDESGLLHYRTDLGKLTHRWQPNADTRIAGHLEGRLQFAPDDDGLSFSSEQQIKNFAMESRDAAGRGYQKLWQEKVLNLNATGQWQPTADQLTLSEGRLAFDGFECQATGQLTDLSRTLQANLQGNTQIDLEKLQRRLQPWVGDELKLTGVSTDPFEIAGPLRERESTAPTMLVAQAASASTQRNRSVELPRDRAISATSAAYVPAKLQAAGGLSWESASGWGFQSGADRLHLQLADQVVTADPLSLPMAGGRVHLSPRVELMPPLLLTLPAGPLVERVAITPEMCQSWMKYVAPLVADATAAQGEFSLRVANAQVPLLIPAQASAEGSITIHAARVGPGPLAREILSLAQQVQSLIRPQAAANNYLNTEANWVDLPEQHVSFRVNNGVVAHDGLTMQIGEVTVRTRGSVGLDQQIALTAYVPIQDDWVTNQRWLAGLRGQTLEVPIRGTLQRPQLDRRALATLTQQTVRGAAEGLLQDELQRQLNRLIPGSR
ncbi:MAG: hypothetical protein KDA92_14335, partial [Planctomycetales bacterium]|nr:hypothetical protein [Planctomycetales bacterium]